jgi:hypothetical protein
VLPGARLPALERRLHAGAVGHAEHLHVAAAGARRSGLDDIQLIGVLDPGGSVAASRAVAPEHAEVDLP